MLKHKGKTLILIFMILSLICSMSFATTEEVAPISEDAQIEATSEGETTLSEEEQQQALLNSYYQNLHSDDLYKIEDVIEVNNLIDGNTYLIGSEVTISGQIGGDLFVIADTINLTTDCYIYGNMYALAETIKIDGIVCDLYSATETLDITENGVILRDLRALSNTLNLNGTVQRNTHLSIASLSVGETAQIGGDLNYESNSAIQVPEGTVGGTINFEQKVSVDTSNSVMDYITGWASAILVAIIVLGLLLLAAPRFTNKVEENAKKNPLLTVLFGLVTVFAIILASVIGFILSATLVGLRISAIIMLLCFIPLVIADTLAVIGIASLIGNKVKVLGKGHNILAVILVATLIWALTLIPFGVGAVISLLAVLYGLGLFARSIFTKKNKAENVVEEKVVEEKNDKNISE